MAIYRYSYTTKGYSNELYHHGIKGQKWGIRRYQNPDGTLTDAGKRRMQKSQKKSDKAYQKTVDRLNKKINKFQSGKPRTNYNRAKIEVNLKYQKQLKQLQDDEIKKYGTYFEEQLEKHRLMGQVLAGIPGQVIAYGIFTARNMDAFMERVAIRDAYISEIAEIKKNRKQNNKNSTPNTRSGDSYSESAVVKKNMSKEDKQKVYNRAKNDDKWDIDFLEGIQNSQIYYDDDRDAMLKEYKKYMDDPDDYMDNQRFKLKQA